MTERGQYPLVLQKDERNGIMIPVGLAEASSLVFGSLSATTVSASNYLNLPVFGGSFTGIMNVCSTGSGTSIIQSIVGGDTLNLKSIAFNTGNFIGTTAGTNEIQVNFDQPLPVANGGTGLTTVPVVNSVVYSNGTTTTGEGTFSYNGGNLSVATGFQINGTAIGIEDLFDGTTQVPNTGEVLTWAGSNWEPMVPTGGISVPNTADQILVSVNSTTVTGEPALTYNTTTNTINFVNASATTNVCASVFVENGTSLINTYLTIANATATYQPAGSYLTSPVNLSTQVTSLLPIVNGGTNSTAFTDNGIVYKSSLLPNATLVNAAAFTYNETASSLLVRNISATNVSATVIVEGGTSLATKYQAADATLTTIASQNPGADSYIYFTGTNAAATGTITSLARDLLADSAASDMRATIELDISNFDNRILYVTNSEALSAAPIPTENTFLKYNSADGYHWTGVTGAGGSITVPNTPDQIVISVNSTTTTGDADFTYNSTTNTINSVNVCATGNVCATVLVENGTSLINTYLTIANATATYQPAGSYLTSPLNLATTALVTDKLNIANGGTGTSTFINAGVIYYDALTDPLQLISEPTFTYDDDNNILSVSNISASAGVSANTFVENGVSLASKYQAADATLTTIASQNPGADSYIYFTGTNAAATGTITSLARDLLNDANFSDMRNTLGLSALATKSQVNLTSADITDTLQIANGGTNANSLANTHGVTFFDGTRLNTDSDLTFVNNLLSTSAFSATIASAGSFVENGTLLASKYLTISNATATYQPLDADLTTLASVATTGVLIFTAGNFASLANGDANTFLKYTGTSYIWTGTDGTATTPAGSNTQIQYNNAGAFGADSGLYWTTGTSRLNALSFSSPAVTATAILWKGLDLETTLADYQKANYALDGVLFFTNSASVDSTSLFTYDNTTNRLSVSAVSATVYNNIALSSQLTDVQITGAVTTGHVLKWTGTKWAPAADDTGAGSNAAGSDGNVQYNNDGTLFGGDESFNFNDTTKVLSVTTASATTVSAGTLHIGGSDGIIRNLNGSINISALNGSISVSAVNSVKLQGIEIDAAQWPQAGTGPAVAFYSSDTSRLLNVRLNSSVINGTRDILTSPTPNQGYIVASYLTSANDSYFGINSYWANTNGVGAQDLPSDKDVLMFTSNLYDLAGPAWTWDKLSLSGGYLTDVATTAPTINKVLAYNGSQWAPTSDLIVDSITATTYNNLPPSVAGISYIMGNNLF